MTRERLRVLIAKPGLDAHDRGAKLLAIALRDAGIEAIYTGLHKTPEEIVKAAIEEDVQVILLSILTGTHIPFTKEIIELLKEHGGQDIPVLCGGSIPERDIEMLKALGVKEVFRPMTPASAVIDYLKEG